MCPFECEIEAPRAVNLDIKFANGVSVSVVGGQKTKAMLTGDQVGYVTATLDALRKQARKDGAKDADCEGGGVRVLDKDWDAIPAGSKKYRALHRSEYDGTPLLAEEKKPAKAAKEAKPAR